MRRWLTLLVAPALAITLVLTSCEPTGTPPEQLAGPTPDSALSAQQGLLDSSDDTDDGTVTSESGDEYTLVQGRIPDDVPDLEVSKVIGADGGSLSLAGHTLTVPAGAVDEPVLFTLTVVADGYVEVDLTAVIEDLLGVLDVGSEGFDEPVTLSLTYAWASNVEDPADLVILRRLGDDRSDPHEVLPTTVDTDQKVVVTQLDRFSRYCMAY